MDEALPFLERTQLLLLDALAAEASAALRFALGRIYFALDGRYDPLACVRESRGALGTLPPAALVAAADQQLAQAERLLLLVAFRPPPARRKFVVSTRQPQLFELERPVIGPPEAAVTPTKEELPAPRASPDGFHSDPLPALSPREWTRQRHEELFSEICALGTQRVPQLGEPWRGAAFLEERLLRDLDALVGLDPSRLGDLEALVVGSAAPDPSQLFGLTLVGGCLSGRDGLGMADRAAHHFEGEPGFAQAWQDALCLSPHPGIAFLLRAHLADSRALRRRVAIETLARRNEVTAEELLRACYDDDEVCAAALLPFVLTGDGRIRELLDEIYVRAERSGGALAEAFLTAVVVAGFPGGRALAESALRGGSALGARLYGISAGRRDAELLLDWTATAPTPALVDALGWAGDPECIPLLIGLLNLEDADLRLSAAAALERITGAGLRQLFSISAEGIIASEPNVRPAPLATPGDVRDPLPEPSAEQLELPSQDADAWRKHFMDNQATLVPHVRTRRGAAYTPHVGWYELDRLPCTPRERRTLHWELVIRSGLLFGFETEAFVPAQEHRLARLGGELAQRSGAPGSWDSPSQRTRYDLG